MVRVWVTVVVEVVVMSSCAATRARPVAKMAATLNFILSKICVQGFLSGL